MANFVNCEVRDHIFLITLNRPEARNAFNLAMAEELEAAVDRYDADPTLRCAVLQAEGPTFSAGQDLIAAGRGEMAITAKRGGFGMLNVPPSKPLIAAIEGQALAGGMEICLCCDIIIASSNAVFGLAEARRGLVAIGGGCFRLPRRIPYHFAMEMLLTAEPKPAEEMQRLGLVNKVVEPSHALDEALSVASSIVRNAPLAVKASKEIATRSQAENWSDTAAWNEQRKVVAQVLNSTDLREGLRAFAEKRQPVWTGA